MELTSLIAHLGGLTPWSLVSLAVILIFTDRLVTRARLEEARTDSQTWRTAYDREREAHNKTVQAHDTMVRETLAVVVDGQEVVNAAIEGIRKKVEGH